MPVGHPREATIAPPWRHEPCPRRSRSCRTRSRSCAWCSSRCSSSSSSTRAGTASWPAGIVFGVAGITDQVDGWLARRWHVESEFGKFADPLADRLMIDAAVVLLFAYDRLPWPALVLILVRDGLLVARHAFALGRGYDFSVSFLGKAATWVLYASIAFILVTDEGTDWPLWLFWSGVALAVARGSPLRRGGLEGGEAMKAVVMAGGEGTRLRPLTSNQPKPMVPIVGKPCMEHIVELLREHGFDDIVVTLAFMPQAIRGYFGAGESHGVSIRYSVEESPDGHGRLGEARRGRARRDVPRHLGRRALRHRPRRARPLPPGEGGARHDRPEERRQPARVRDRRHRRGRADRALPREAVLGPGLHGHDQHGHLRARARGAPPCARGTAVRLLQGALPAPPRDGPAALRLRRRGLLAGHRQPRPVPAGELRRARRARAPRHPRDPAARQRLGGGGGRARRPRVGRGPAFIGNYCRIAPQALGRAVLGALAERDARASTRARRARSSTPRRTSGGARSSRAPSSGKSCDIRPHARLHEGVAVGDSCTIGEESVVMPGVRIYPFKEVESGALVDRNLIWESRLAVAPVRARRRLGPHQRRSHARDRPAARDRARHCAQARRPRRHEPRRRPGVPAAQARARRRRQLDRRRTSPTCTSCPRPSTGTS